MKKTFLELHEFVSKASFMPFAGILKMASLTVAAQSGRSFTASLGLIGNADRRKVQSINPFKLTFKHNGGKINFETDFAVDSEGRKVSDEQAFDLYINTFRQAEILLQFNEELLLAAGYKLTRIETKELNVELYTIPYLGVSRSFFVYAFIEETGICKGGYCCFIDSNEEGEYFFNDKAFVPDFTLN